MRQLLKDSAFFSASRYFILGLGFVRNLVIAKFLSPTAYGAWVFITLVLTYGDQVHLGLRHLGDKEIPYRRGRSEATVDFANTIYGGVIIFSIVAFLLLTAYAFFNSGIDENTKFGIYLASGIILADQVNRFYYMILRAHQEFVLASKIESLAEILRTLLLAVGVILFELPGALVGMVLSALLLAAYFGWRYRLTYRPQWQWRTLAELFRLGLPLFITGALFILLSNADRLAIALRLSAHDLGLYGLVALLVAVPFNAVQALGFVIFPRLSEQFGRHGQASMLEPFFSKILTAAVLFTPPLVTSVFLATPAVITGFLPAYVEAIPLALVLLPGVYFFTIVQLPSLFLIAVERTRRYIVIEFVMLVVMMMSYFVGFKMAPNRITVAGVTAISFFFLTTLLLLTCYKTAGYSLAGRFKTIAKIYLPFLFSLVWLALLFKIFPYHPMSSFSPSLLWSLRHLTLYLIVYGAIVVWAMQRHGYWSRLRMELIN